MIRALRVLLAATVLVGGLTTTAATATAGTTDCGVVPAAGGQTLAGSRPVLFVHGMASAPSAWLAGDDPIGRQAAAIHGVTSWAFDYSAAALDWVTDPRIGPALATAISCLATGSGHSVIVVAHSMGGLATQYAVSQPDGNGGKVADHVSEVITIGTPFLGSALLSDVQGAVSTTENALLRSSPLVAVGIEATLSACAAYAADDNTDNPCGLLSVGRSPVGTALRYGSAQIAALPPWPAGLPVLPMAGNIEAPIGIGSFSSTVDIGDVPVTPDSAVAVDTAGAPPVQVYCHLNGILDLVRNATSNPCFHVGLQQNRTIDAAVLSLIKGLANGPGPNDISGKWVGTYTCAQGLTGMELDLTQGANGALTGVWNFYAVPSNPTVQTGATNVSGTYTGSGVTLNFQSWINQPAGYVEANLSGTVADDGARLTGNVLSQASGCTTFSLTRMSAVDASAMRGTWRGTYVCAQGLTALSLDVTAQPNGDLTATFNFGAVPSNPGVPTGSYSMTGHVYPGSVVLKQNQWINQPAGYVMVDIVGTPPSAGADVFTGSIPQCPGAISLRKSR